MQSFEFLEPTTVQEAVALLNQHRGSARLLAGGTDVVIRMKQRAWTPEYVINLKKIPELSYIKGDEQQGLRIGALTPLRQIERSSIVQQHYPAIAQGCHEIGSVQIRNLATLAGNICNASPAGDGIPALLAYGAHAKIVGPDGEKAVPLSEFFTGPGRSILGDHSILVEIQVPAPPPRSGSAYLKHCIRGAMDIAVVGAAAMVALGDGDSRCDDIRIALASVAPTPIRVPQAEAILKGQVLTPALIEQAAVAAAGAIKPISDVRGSADHRIEMTRILTKRAVTHAVANAEQQ